MLNSSIMLHSVSRVTLKSHYQEALPDKPWRTHLLSLQVTYKDGSVTDIDLFSNEDAEIGYACMFPIDEEA